MSRSVHVLSATSYQALDRSAPLLLAYVLIVATLGLGLPLAFRMCDQVPAVTTLARQ